MEIDVNKLPIPDWGLDCPQCGYPLRGLPVHVCPECGHSFRMHEIVKPWTRVREPRFNGGERPVPDFGIDCTRCGAPLAGADANQCPTCGAVFDLTPKQKGRSWIVVDTHMAKGVPAPMIENLLESEHIPYLPREGQNPFGHYFLGAGESRVYVPADFYFDVLWTLQNARQHLQQRRAEAGDQEWLCLKCGEFNPATFELCWKCEQPCEASEDNEPVVG